MAKTVKNETNTSILPSKSWDFLKKYIDNASPVGFESSGQKLWLDYLTPDELKKTNPNCTCTKRQFNLEQ